MDHTRSERQADPAITLAQWLEHQIQAHNLTQQATAVYAGVSGATLSDILNKGHLPRLDILFRLADYFDTPREYVVRLAARMPIEDSQPIDQDEYLVQELLDAFRQVPDDWKPEALAQVQMFVRLANRPSVRFVGDEEASRAVQEEKHEAPGPSQVP
jgi:transcriptional regulator with XRE-family HTH domain